MRTPDRITVLLETSLHCRPLVLVPSPLSVLLSGCDVGHDYARPALDMPAAYRATAETAAAAWPAADWWQGFRSPELNALIEQARAHNFDIAAAIARVRQADAQVRIAGAPLLPDYQRHRQRQLAAPGPWNRQQQPPRQHHPRRRFERQHRLPQLQRRPQRHL